MEIKKDYVIDRINSISDGLIDLSHSIHENPETAFNEFKTVKIIKNYFRSHGIEISIGIGGIETSFIATKKGNKLGPHIAFIAEYDALPNIGHGCGHNIIATCSIGAFLGAISVIDEFAGSVSIIGTPAEENGGGKIIMLKNGVFEDIDFVLMMHPSSGSSIIGRGGRAATKIDMEFLGKSAHSSQPNSGINALSAAINTFNNIDALRATFEMQDNVNGIITHGGDAPNIIPNKATCRFSLRSRTLSELNNLVEKVNISAQSACLLTGARSEIRVHNKYGERYPNIPMCEAFKANMSKLGEIMDYPDPNAMYGSSDIGNVSIKIPAIHDYLYIADKNVNAHSKEFTEAAISSRADEVCIKGAQGLAMTALDILSNPEFRKEILIYHKNQVPEEYHELDL